MRVLLSSAFVVVLGACSAPPAPVCGVGETRVCVGQGACTGGQVCLADGSGFGPCDCGTTGGGGGSVGGGGGSTGGGGGSVGGGGGSVGGGTGGGATGGGGGAVGGGTGGGATGGGGGAAGGGTGGGSNDAGTDAGIDGGDDAGVDAGMDAGTDAGMDAGSDAGTDAGTDAGQVIDGQLLFVETQVLNPGTSGTFFGQGLEASFAFRPASSPAQEEQPGTLLGCKAWILSPSEAASWNVGLDEGALQVVASGTTTLTGPSCTWSANEGYLCPHVATGSTGGVISAVGQPGVAALTDPDVSFNAGNSSGAYVRIQGATSPGNNGLFPIVALANANTVVFANPAFVVETMPATAFHVNQAFAGVIPGVASPGFLDDAANLSISLTSGGAADLASFTAATAQTVGNGFTLGLQDLNLLNAVPRDGTAFTFTCDATNCPAGSALFTQLDVVTTDGVTAGLSPFAMPAPITRSVRVQCRAIGVTAVTVPAPYSALLQSSGATRIETTFLRLNLMAGGPATVFSAAGHGVRGFSN